MIFKGKPISSNNMITISFLINNFAQPNSIFAKFVKDSDLLKHCITQWTITKKKHFITHPNQALFEAN